MSHLYAQDLPNKIVVHTFDICRLPLLAFSFSLSFSLTFFISVQLHYFTIVWVCALFLLLFFRCRWYCCFCAIKKDSKEQPIQLFALTPFKHYKMPHCEKKNKKEKSYIYMKWNETHVPSCATEYVKFENKKWK